MKYDKNKWKDKLGIKKIEGGYEIPLVGSMLSIKSTLENLSFDDKPEENIRIMGKYTLESEGTILKYEELNKELVSFFNEQIRKQRVIQVKFTKKMDLEIKIDSSPVIIIRVSTDSIQYPIEKWEYNYKSGYVLGS